MLMGAVGLVLVIVAANILSLLLTRSIARRREMGLRAALGASGWRILRQLLVENAVLCILGGPVGVVLAEFATPALMHLSPLPLPQFASLHIGGSALLFAAALMLACALLFSLVPAAESRRTQLNESLRVNSAQVAGRPQPGAEIAGRGRSGRLPGAAGSRRPVAHQLLEADPRLSRLRRRKRPHLQDQLHRSAGRHQRLARPAHG